jgi:hypothetical protein
MGASRHHCRPAGSSPRPGSTTSRRDLLHRGQAPPEVSGICAAAGRIAVREELAAMRPSRPLLFPREHRRGADPPPPWWRGRGCPLGTGIAPLPRRRVGARSLALLGCRAVGPCRASGWPGTAKRALGPGLGWQFGPVVRHGPARKDTVPV